MPSITKASISRTFCDLPEFEAIDLEKVATYARASWHKGSGWGELFQSPRILIISEAGSSKTYECQKRQNLLWDAGEAAFFLDLATLAVSSVREMLIHEEECRLDLWLRSQSDVATFFLDSIDELSLTLGKFDQALKRLRKAIEGQLGRVRIIITTRPIPLDRDLIQRYLPIPTPAEAAPTAELFADKMLQRSARSPSNIDSSRPWRTVTLLSLTREQISSFALSHGVTNHEALLADIEQRDAWAFAQRPQDLIELCADWREHQRIRTDREQVETNIQVKLKPRMDRKERSALSQDQAIEDASCLALAALLTRKLTLRHNAEAEAIHVEEAALDVPKILHARSSDDRTTLLERPLFAFASYGRVRFHHRSVLEYLAAKRLDVHLLSGRSIKAIKRLLFAETAHGSRTIRPTMRPVAAWLSLSQKAIFEELVATDPAVLLDYGDPQSLDPSQRTKALEAYVNQHGRGGWRGLGHSAIQVNRFASPELDAPVRRLWHLGIENDEVRELLLELIGFWKTQNMRRNRLSSSHRQNATCSGAEAFN